MSPRKVFARSGVALLACTALIAGASERAGIASLNAQIPASREELVIPDASIGPLRMQVRRFTDTREPARLRADVEQAWRARPAPIMPSMKDGWSLLTQADGGWVETVGVRAKSGGSEGIRIRVRAETPANRRDTRWLGALAAARAREVNRVDHHDGTRLMTTSIWTVPGVPDGLGERIVKRAAARGLVPGKGALRTDTAAVEAIFVAGRREELVATVSNSEHGVMVVFHWSGRE